MTGDITHTHTHGAAELTVNARTIDLTLESILFVFRSQRRPADRLPAAAPKASDAAFRAHVRHMKPKQTTTEGRVHRL